MRNLGLDGFGDVFVMFLCKKVGGVFHVFGSFGKSLQELLSTGHVELVGAPSTSWKTKAGTMVNWQLA